MNVIYNNIQKLVPANKIGEQIDLQVFFSRHGLKCRKFGDSYIIKDNYGDKIIFADLGIKPILWK